MIAAASRCNSILISATEHLLILLTSSATSPSITTIYTLQIAQLLLLYYTTTATTTTTRSINDNLLMPAVVVNIFTTSFVEWRKQSCRILPTLSFHQTEIWAKPAKRNTLQSHRTFVHIPVILQAIALRRRYWSACSMDAASLINAIAMIMDCCSGSGRSCLNIIQAFWLWLRTGWATCSPAWARFCDWN